MRAIAQLRRLPLAPMTLHHGEATSELPDDWWATADVLTYLASVGAPISRGTWTSYVARGQAPAAERVIGKTRVWRPATVKAWHESRRGQGWRARERN